MLVSCTLVCLLLAGPGLIMFVTATCGLLVNLMMMKILHQDVGGSLHGHSHAGGDGHGHAAHGHGGNINVRVRRSGGRLPGIAVVCVSVSVWLLLWSIIYRGHAVLAAQAAFIHVIGDLIQSIGVMIAAAFIWYSSRPCIVYFSFLSAVVEG